MAGDLIILFAALFVPGLVLTAGAAYVFLRHGQIRIANIPVWLPLLFLGLALTLVVPAATLFLGFVGGDGARRAVDLAVHTVPTVVPSPRVTCYIAAEPTPQPMCYKVAVSPLPSSGGLVTMDLARRELLERLAKEGRVPGDAYRRLTGKK